MDLQAGQGGKSGFARPRQTCKLSGAPRVDTGLPAWESLGRSPWHKMTFRELQ